MEMKKKTNDFLSGLFKNQSKKKLIENAAIVIIIGVIIIIAGGSIFGSSKKNKNEDNSIRTAAGNKTDSVSSENASSLEKELEAILSRIKGVGKVSAMITFASTSEDVPAYETEKNSNDTDEKDSGGGTRSINENSYKDNVIYEDLPGGGKKPVIVKKKQPEVKGVVVAADGASDPEVKESICMAVQALLDVPMHMVQVFERE
jgi:stage III sporulation protein AG